MRIFITDHAHNIGYIQWLCHLRFGRLGVRKQGQWRISWRSGRSLWPSREGLGIEPCRAAVRGLRRRSRDKKKRRLRALSFDGNGGPSGGHDTNGASPPSCCSPLPDRAMGLGQRLIEWPNNRWNALIARGQLLPVYLQPQCCFRLLSAFWQRAAKKHLSPAHACGEAFLHCLPCVSASAPEHGAQQPGPGRSSRWPICFAPVAAAMAGNGRPRHPIQQLVRRGRSARPRCTDTAQQDGGGEARDGGFFGSRPRPPHTLAHPPLPSGSLQAHAIDNLVGTQQHDSTTQSPPSGRPGSDWRSSSAGPSLS